MAVGSTTLAGGDTVSFNLDLSQIAAVQNAIAALSASFTSSEILTDPNTSFSNTDPSVEHIFNVDGGTTFPNYTHAGTNATILDSVNGTADTSIYGGLASNLLIVGNEGNDTITLDQGGTVFAGSGNDIISAHNYDPLTVNVGNGNDSITTFSSATVVAGSGNDTITLGSGTDPSGIYNVTVEGNDTIHVGLGQATITNTNPSGSTLLENTSGASADITYTGFGTDTIYLGAGANTVTEYGAATVFGGAAPGHSTIAGGTTLVYHNGGAADSVVAGTGNASLDAGNALGANVTLVAGAGNDTLDGSLSTANDSFVGGAGDATMFGGSGNDTFTGGTGFSSMVGGSGDNTFIGSSGSNEMHAQLGSSWNSFYGGSGSDTMYADTQQLPSGADPNTFFFNASVGGSHTIIGYTDNAPGDYSFHLDFTGYNQTADQIVGDSHINSDGNLEISLPASGGGGPTTTVTLVGVTTLDQWHINSH